MKNFLVRPYTTGDEQKINKLFEIVFNKERPLEQWYWKFKKCPYGSIIALGISRDYGLTSHYAGIKLKATLQGSSEIMAVSGVDAMRHPKYGRSSGKSDFIFTARQFGALAKKENIKFLYGIPSDHHKNRGLRYLDYIAGPEIIPLSLTLEDLSLPVRRLAFNKPFYKIEEKQVLEKKEINEAWDRIKSQYPLIVNRDFQYYHWRFDKNPKNSFTYFIIKSRVFQKLVGWCVLLKQRKKIFIVDLIIPRKRIHLIDSLLATLKIYYKKGELCLWLPENCLEYERLTSLGFKKERRFANLIFRPFFDHEDIKDAFDNFFFTMSDYDLF